MTEMMWKKKMTRMEREQKQGKAEIFRQWRLMLNTTATAQAQVCHNPKPAGPSCNGSNLMLSENDLNDQPSPRQGWAAYVRACVRAGVFCVYVRG